MNERIQELWRGCVLKHTNIPMNWQNVADEFAELIVRDTLDQVAEFNRLTKAYQTQGIDPEIDITKEVLKNYGFTRFPRS